MFLAGSSLRHNTACALRHRYGLRGRAEALRYPPSPLRGFGAAGLPASPVSP